AGPAAHPGPGIVRTAAGTPPGRGGRVCGTLRIGLDGRVDRAPRDGRTASRSAQGPGASPGAAPGPPRLRPRGPRAPRFGPDLRAVRPPLRGPGRLSAPGADADASSASGRPGHGAGGRARVD